MRGFPEGKMERASFIPPPASFAAQDWFDARAGLRGGFLARAGWAGAPLRPIGEDCAFRRYFRLTDGTRSVVLMEAVPDGYDIATPGHRLVDFIRIGGWLRGRGFSAPEIYEADEENGYLLIEDFGDVSFMRAGRDGADAARLYETATDVLAALRDLSRAPGGGIELPDYYQSHVHKGRRRIVDWYMPCLRGAANPDGLAEEYLAVWDAIEKSLPPEPAGFLHIDYHFENLMWLPDRAGVRAAGILDFQGAMNGPSAYDLANLLEDARVDVPPDLRAAMMDRFCRGMAADARALFRERYRILATQFHCRVAGQFIRLALRDGKTRYLRHLPRVARYLKEGLEHPVLAPLKDWFGAQGVRFDAPPDVGPGAARLIRGDAF